MSMSLTQLYVVETAARVLAKGLAVAEFLGLPVTSWQAGDPTRSLYHYLAEILAAKDEIAVQYIKSGFLDDAEGDWLTIVAKQVYNVDRDEATAAANELTLSNSGGGYYEWEPGDITFKASSTGRTYHSTTSLTLAAGETGTVSFEADDVGSDYSVSANEIDELVTTALNVTITSSGAATAIDAQSDASLRTVCKASIGALSPNGPNDAYEFVALSSALTGTAEVTRAKSLGDTDTGDVTLYIAGSAGAVSGGALTAVEDAIAQWATPLCITPTVENADTVPVAITATVDVYQTVGAAESVIEDAIIEALQALFAEVPIGGNEGYLHRALLVSTIREVYKTHTFNVTLSSPASDVGIDSDEVATINGTPDITVVFH